MIITLPWLKKHLKTKANENEIIEKLINIGLEVESIKENSGELGKFKIAKIIKAEKHPNADKLKVCEVNIGEKETLKVVCGAPNAREGLVTIYAPPGAVIPKNKFKLKTLDEVCIKNTVSCMRRYPNTAYVSKLTGERNGYYCRQFPSKEILTLSMDEIMEALKLVPPLAGILLI